MKRNKDQDLEYKERSYSLCRNKHGRMYFYNKNIGMEEICHERIAKAKYNNKINETGWAYLQVEIAHKHIPLHEQGYAAGFLEGRATRDLIDLHIKNTVDGFCDGAADFCHKLGKYLHENYIWMLSEIEHYPNDKYWKQVNMTLNQLKGMINGYEGKLYGELSVKDIVVHPIYLIQLAGDLEDLTAKFKKPDNPNRMKTGKGHCSALVKLLPSNKDLLFSHVTWSSYSSMLRLQKKYVFKTSDAGHSYAFSGYPASISSVDDFIVTSSELAILETTIGNYNEELMQYMTPKSVPCWIRSQVAHRSAASGIDWAESFAKHNSGTYNNQWVIVDYKNFKRGNEIEKKEGIIHVLEQLPHHIVYSDMTSYLFKTSYWPSYNSPYFPQIIKWSGVQSQIDKYGDWFTYDKTPRALIFNRDHKNVIDTNTMIKLMRSNNYTMDPLSRCNCTPPYSAENAISCRSDLNPSNGKYPFEALGYRDHGATDMKLTNSHLINSLSFIAISGPTHDPTPVFDWESSTFKDKVPHYGQPIRWEFPPVQHEWIPTLFTSSEQKFFQHLY